MGTLRFILALSVAFSHVGLPFGFLTSEIAVQSFFVISGFYMALVLHEKYRSGSYFLFISNRLLRLFPAYLVLLILSLAVADKWKSILALDPIGSAYFIVTQLVIVGQETYFFLIVKDGGLAFTLHPAGVPNLLYTFAPIPQAWTLALEIYFYLLAPFLVGRRPMVIVAMIAASLTFRMGLQWACGFSGDPWSGRLFPSELALFFAGYLGYQVYALRAKEQRSRLNRLLLLVAALIFGCLAINGIHSLGSLAFLAVVIVCIPRLFELSKDVAWDKFLGEISYPLYICHFLIGWILLPETVPGAYGALGLAIMASVLLYFLVDRPVDHWRQARFARSRGTTTEPGLILPV
jgi:peptidoglycan/LPS O-acetylase OafA/YrhL